MKSASIFYIISALLLINLFSCREMPNIQNSTKIKFAQNGLIFSDISDKRPITIIHFGFFYYDKEKKDYEIFLVGNELTRTTLEKNEVLLSTEKGYVPYFKTNTYYTYDMRTENGNIAGSFMIIDIENPTAEYEIDYKKTRDLRILQNNEKPGF